MRNIFDQYERPENRLTHAVFSVLDRDRSLLSEFLKWLGVPGVPHLKALRITEQQVPGTAQSDTEKLDSQGLPDACVFTDDNWVVLFESKVQATLTARQIVRHLNNADRHGFNKPYVVVITVEPTKASLPQATIELTWQDVYRWFAGKATKSRWARELVDYMHIFERKMLAREYDIRGTITVFDGLKFDNQNPYTYREAKRLLRLLGDALQPRKDLRPLGVDPNGKRRPAITGGGVDPVWDFLPLRIARDAKQFTEYPHLTMYLRPSAAGAGVTIPNGIKNRVRPKLSHVGLNGFMDLVADLEMRLRPIVLSTGAKPRIYATQRHFRTQRSQAEVDARLDADLRTAVPGIHGPVKCQPQWIEAIYEVMVKKRSNLQLGVDVDFSYACPLVRSKNAIDLFADSWKALRPLLAFALGGVGA